ncbi:LysR substrate-binding domain-containing protein, partial [Intestinibacter sp.]
LTVGAILLSDILNDLEKIDPNLDTFAYVNNTSVIEQKLLESSLDVAIVEGKVKSNDLISIPMIDDYLVLVCGVDHPLANKKEVRLSDLENQKFVVREKGSGTREVLDDFLKFHNLQVKIVWEANSPDTIKHAIINNGCLALMPMRVMQKEIEEHKMNVIYNTTDEWNRYFSLVYHKDKNMTNSIVLLKDILKKYKSLDIEMDDLSSKLVLD